MPQPQGLHRRLRTQKREPQQARSHDARSRPSHSRPQLTRQVPLQSASLTNTTSQAHVHQLRRERITIQNTTQRQHPLRRRQSRQCLRTSLHLRRQCKRQSNTRSNVRLPRLSKSQRSSHQESHVKSMQRHLLILRRHQNRPRFCPSRQARQGRKWDRKSHQETSHQHRTQQDSSKRPREQRTRRPYKYRTRSRPLFQHAPTLSILQQQLRPPRSPCQPNTTNTSLKTTTHRGQ